MISTRGTKLQFYTTYTLKKLFSLREQSNSFLAWRTAPRVLAAFDTTSRK